MNKRLFLFLLACSAVSFAGQLFVFPHLPEIIPVHWNMAGEADSTAPRIMQLVHAALPAVLSLFMYLIPRLDPRRKNYQSHTFAYGVCSILIVFLILGFSWATALVPLGFSIPLSRISPVALGIMLVLLGNYMPQIRPTFLFGIRTPWTISSETVWRKTHRLGGILYCAAGLLIFAGAFLPLPLPLYLGIPLFLLLVLIPVGYSYLQFRKQPPAQGGAHAED